MNTFLAGKGPKVRHAVMCYSVYMINIWLRHVDNCAGDVVDWFRFTIFHLNVSNGTFADFISPRSLICRYTCQSLPFNICIELK